MKKQTSVTIKKESAASGGSCLLSLSAGALLLLGLWGMLWQWLAPAQKEWQAALVLAAALAALTLSLLFRQEKRLHWILSFTLLTGLLVAAILLRGRLSAAAAELGNLAKQRIFLQTGRYALPFDDAGDLLWMLVPSAFLSGILTGALLRCRWGHAAFALLACAVLGLMAAGLLSGGWFFAVYLAGVLLCFSRRCRGNRLLLCAALAALALILAGVARLPGVVPQTGADKTMHAIHRLRYEDNENPMPEGRLTAARPAASNQPALEVSMKHWTPLYLRGYVAGEYTGTGWERLSAAALENDAQMLYALQSSCFSPSTQLAAAWASQDAAAENRMTIVPLGACREHLYLPYGAMTDLLDASDLTGEGSRTAMPQRYEMAVYPVEESYTLQRTLSQELTADSYRQAEAVYRQWVYAHYLSVPQRTYDVLTQSFTPSPDWTTTQAKTEILQFLSKAISYRETAAVSGTDVASAVLTGSRQGGSVHYATLAALLLRCCGIPARYVEGYAVASQQAEVLADGDTLTLTERNAHAWTEYYLDGVGWIPFDATPGYTDLVRYTLPEDGTQTEDGRTQTQVEQPQTEQNRAPEITEEPQGSHTVYVRNALLTALALLLLILLGLVLRTALLRRRLRRQRALYDCGDSKRACAAILCGIHDLLAVLKPGCWDAYDASHEAQLAAALNSEEAAQEIAALEREIWYSGHPIDDVQRERARTLLTVARERWRQTTPRGKRLIQRFITCKVF